MTWREGSLLRGKRNGLKMEKRIGKDGREERKWEEREGGRKEEDAERWIEREKERKRGRRKVILGRFYVDFIL